MAASGTSLIFSGVYSYKLEIPHLDIASLHKIFNLKIFRLLQIFVIF